MGQKPKDIDQVKRVADYFKVSLDELVFGETSASQNQKLVTILTNELLNKKLEIKITGVLSD